MSSSSSYGAPPLGVAILAFVTGFVGIVYLLFGILVLFAIAAAVSFVPHLGVGLFAAVVLFVLGALLLLVATGLWDRELWALVLCIVVVGFGLLSFVLAGALFSIGGLILLLLLVYLVAVHGEFT